MKKSLCPPVPPIHQPLPYHPPETRVSTRPLTRMALRLDGFENVRLLYGGFNEWKARGGMEAHARASKKN